LNDPSVIPVSWKQQTVAFHEGFPAARFDTWNPRKVIMKTQDVLVQLRKDLGLTQDEMAAKLFVTRQAVSRWETGATTPNPETMKLISKEFKI